jgi:hypothetical protein
MVENRGSTHKRRSRELLQLHQGERRDAPFASKLGDEAEAVVFNSQYPGIFLVSCWGRLAVVHIACGSLIMT